MYYRWIWNIFVQISTLYVIFTTACVINRRLQFINSALAFYIKGKGKGKVLPITGHEGSEREQICSSTLPSTSALDGGGWSAPRSGCSTPGKDPVPIVQEAGWAPGPVWTGAENITPTGIRSPDRPAHSESLYRLSYPGRFGSLY